MTRINNIDPVTNVLISYTLVIRVILVGEIIIHHATGKVLFHPDYPDEIHPILLEADNPPGYRNIKIVIVS